MTETDSQYLPLTNSEARKIFYPDLKLTVILFFITLLNMVLVAIPVGIILGTTPDLSLLLKSVFNMVLYIAPLLLTINYALRKSKKQQGCRTSINFMRVPAWLIPLVIAGALALIIPLNWVSSLIPMPRWVHRIFETTFTKDAFSIATISIAAPIMEEILFRGIILKGLLMNYRPYSAILISAIFFSLIHLNPWQAVPAFIGGMYMGWVYYKTQSVIPGIVIHFTINFTVSMMLFLPAPEQDFSTFLGLHYYILAMLTSMFIFVGVCVVIHKKVKVILGNSFNRIKVTHRF